MPTSLILAFPRISLGRKLSCRKSLPVCLRIRAKGLASVCLMSSKTRSVSYPAEMFHVQLRFVPGQNKCALERVLQFAYVSRACIPPQQRQRSRRDPLRGNTGLAAQLAEKLIYQQRNVLAALPQPR